MNNLIRLVLAGMTISTLSGCTPISYEEPIPQYTFKNSFDAVQAGQLILGEGTAKIKGNAFLKQKGGTVVTCAGNEVQLIPYTEYANERLSLIYGNVTKGYNSYYGRSFKFVNDDKNYHTYKKKTVCDSEGKFEFDNLKEGTYFVSTEVSWKISKYLTKYSEYPTEVTEGGYLLQQVQVNKDDSKSIVLTR
ncbi:TPA: hypothetical protein ACU21B_001897 [Mannheimia haemolytica]